MANTIKLGAGKWATGTDTVLAFNDENNNFKPLPFDFSRASSATVVNQSGLIETVGSGTPRIDFLDNTKGALLLEPSRTNLFTYSEDFSNVAWSKQAVTISLNTIIGLDGALSASVLARSTGVYQSLRMNMALVVGNSYTISCWAKADFDRYITLGLTYSAGNYAGTQFDLQNGTILRTSSSGTDYNATNPNIKEFDNGWYRVSVTLQTGVADSYPCFIGSNTIWNSGWFNINEVGDGVNGLYLYGAQLEQGSYATSYIPTSGQSGGVTRVLDSCNQTVPDGVIGQTEGTILVDVDFKTLSGTNMFVSIRPDASNKIEIYRSDAVIYGEFASNASFNFNKPSVTVGRYKIAVAYSSGSSAMYINGVLIGSNITPFAFTSTLDGIYINSRGTTFIEQSSYNDLKLYNTRLSNAELASLTTI